MALTRPPSLLAARSARATAVTSLPRAPFATTTSSRRSRLAAASASAADDDAAPAAAAAASAADKTNGPAATEISPLKKAVFRHTLTSMYVAPEDRVPDIPKIDWDARRRKRERQEIAAAGARLKPPLAAGAAEKGLDDLEALLPGVPVGSLDLLKASEWARVASDPSRAARSALALRAAFPRADVALIIKRAPRLALLRAPEDVARDAAAARAALDPTLGRDDLGAVDACVELVPDLCTPRGVATALALLRKWHAGHDPFDLLRADPTLVSSLVNQDESDLAADPSYGEELGAF